MPFLRSTLVETLFLVLLHIRDDSPYECIWCRDSNLGTGARTLDSPFLETSVLVLVRQFQE